jgi:hypothetical protein
MLISTELRGFNINYGGQYLMLPILISSDEKHSFSIVSDFFECEVEQKQKDILFVTTYLDEKHLGKAINVHGVEIVNEVTEKFKGVIEIDYRLEGVFKGSKLVDFTVNIRTTDNKLIRYLNALAYLHFQCKMNESLEEIKNNNTEGE